MILASIDATPSKRSLPCVSPPEFSRIITTTKKQPGRLEEEEEEEEDSNGN
jgi:hypothetical protein